MTIEKEKGNMPVRTIVETGLKMAVIRQCPECAADINLKEGTRNSEIMDCPDCGFELETVFFNPDDPVEVKKLMETARKQGSNKDKKYDVSHLNLTESPSFIPAPQEEEDWGE